MLKSFQTLGAVCVILIASMSSSFSQSTSSTSNSKPSTPPRRAPVISPELLSDGSVTFRLMAPKAKEVKVSGQFGKETSLNVDSNGLWSVNIPSVPSGVHEYHFTVDGLNVIDPQNSAVKPQRWPGVSILHVPSRPPAPWDLQDIPHGTLHEHTYLSKALGQWRHLVVYTPPGYTATARRLPVLYLAHGYSDKEETWTVHGKAHWILDHLIATGKVVPMIVVMPDAHALPPGSTPFEEYGPANSAAFAKEVIQDIIPLVESNYKVSAKPASRAFAGLSMGGHHALTIALNHHETFSFVGAFSSAPPPVTAISKGLDHPEAVNKHLKLLWIACGQKDFLFQRNEECDRLLKEKGVRHEYVVTEGDHSWPVWRRYLTEFTPKLFR